MQLHVDSVRNQALNRKYLLDLIKGRLKNIKRMCHANCFLNFDQS